MCTSCPHSSPTAPAPQSTCPAFPCSSVPVSKACRVHTLERLCPSPHPTYILSRVSNFTLISFEARVAFCALRETKHMG